MSVLLADVKLEETYTSSERCSCQIHRSMTNLLGFILCLLQIDGIVSFLIDSGNYVSSGSLQQGRRKQRSRLFDSIYDHPPMYDLAFGYRDFNQEVSFLLNTHKRVAGQPAASVLELAAGPARHAWTASAQSLHAVALDTSPAMQTYALSLQESDYPNCSLDYSLQDMRNFTLDNKVDTAWLLLGSLQHLTANEDIIATLTSIKNALHEGGTLVVELPHPRETFQMTDCTRNGWEIPLEDSDAEDAGSLQIVWGDDNDEFDSIAQVRHCTVSFEMTGADKISQIVPMRLFTAQEMKALATCAGLRLVEMHGALEEDVAVDDDDLAFRLVCVLQR